MEFKVGDRVRYVVQRDIDNVKVGEVGIIRGISPYGNYAVDFEESGYKHNCERIKHMDWHVECRKARHERYRLRKRAKEIVFEEAAQKMAKEITKENK